MYFWSLSYVDNDKFILLLEKKTIIPFDPNKKLIEVLLFCWFLDTIRINIENSMDILTQLKEEYDQYLKNNRYNHTSETSNDLSTLASPTIVKVSFIKGIKGLAENGPYSSPILD
ncbi:unnamed protein product [Cunninghamella blakesleeana]